MSTLNNPWCQELFENRHNRSCNSAGQYLFVEAQGSEGLFDGCEVFPALGRGFRYSRALPWKASAKISRVRVEGWSNDFTTEQNSNTRMKPAVVLMKRVIKIITHDFNFPFVKLYREIALKLFLIETPNLQIMYYKGMERNHAH